MTNIFKLQPVLNYRQTLEDEACQRLAQAIEREAPLQRQLVDSRERLHYLCGELDDRQRTGIAVAELMLHKARIHGVGERIKERERELERLQREIAEYRQALCAASRDKKLLEKLKEKVVEEQRQFQNRQETILLDEIALQFAKR
jgi:flagellar protein FliJ